MTSKFINSFAVAVTLCACVPPITTQSRRPVTPEEGPKGTVRVDFHGGAFTRQIQPRFRLDESGYVLVGHLGGDGRISVLYPKTPSGTGWVAAGKTIYLGSHSAINDAAPRLFSFASTPWRSFAAQMDSYDGLGHGYVFMITSRSPIDYDAADASGFDALELTDYEDAWDPRLSIRSLADDLVSGPYSLKFAGNRSGSLYARATGCPQRWGLMTYGRYDYVPWMDVGYSYFTYPGISLMNGFAFARDYGMRSCRGRYYAYAPQYYRTYVTTTIPTSTPSGPLTPRLQRPERRTLTDPDRTAIVGGRSALDRGNTTFTRRTSGGRSRPAEESWRRSDATRPRREFIERPERGSTATESSRPPERASRPMDTPRVTPPSPPPTTTTSSSSSGGETKAERPRPQP